MLIEFYSVWMHKNMSIVKEYGFSLTNSKYYIYRGRVFVKSNTQTSTGIKLLKYSPERLLQHIKSNRTHWTIS